MIMIAELNNLKSNCKIQYLFMKHFDEKFFHYFNLNHLKIMNDENITSPSDETEKILAKNAIENKFSQKRKIISDFLQINEYPNNESHFHNSFIAGTYPFSRISGLFANPSKLKLPKFDYPFDFLITETSSFAISNLI